ncbi:nitric oxide reductase activation protein NorD [Acuticoccus sp. I52.16.1]|uniref:nitric oxide reductase activation protein NorD n=1 Tax=Acuticoccus sp. I52.16.1 TaxID=2928472 RepID=UPI001FD23313|nr:VWA domain-containing protein [Acuticoccus sp. I52.16.1]UOM34159.1 VWA domain-containing protein [Acuticoccus sp. I52.16.1]
MAGRAPFLKVVGTPQAPPAAPAAFAPPFLAPYLRAVRKLDGAGYGASLVAAYERAAAEVAAAVGPEPAIEMADTVSAVVVKAGRRSGERVADAAGDAARRFADPLRFRSWLGLMQRFAAMAPDSVAAVGERMATLLGTLDLSGLEAWLLAGVREAGGDTERRAAFFSFDRPEAARWLAREAGEVVFADHERRLKAYLCALFDVHVPIREPAPGAPEPQRRRPGFAEGLIRMPPTFPGYRGEAAQDVFRAALAHVGAHIRFTGARFPVGQLKPMQVAVVSLIEDARVEALAMRELPGLKRLWLPFHIAHPSGPATAPSLFARLARALIDPDFEDRDGWVRKGRDLFHAAAERMEDPAISRRIGNVLGNDLGQMRVQFNAKTYVVEPPYRDDNLGLWDFGEAPPEDEEAEVIVEAVTIRQTREDEGAADRDRPEEADEGHTSVRLADPDPAAGVPVARYPEYDYQVGRERADWVTVKEYAPRLGSARTVTAILERHHAVRRRIEALIKTARVGRPERLKRRIEGEALDLDAVLDAAIDRRTGSTPDERVYQTTARRQRSLSVLVLVDTSQSTRDRVKGATTSVLDMERDATLLLAEAMDGLGDAFALAAFASDTREDVRYTRLKDFTEDYGGRAREALAGLAPGYSTRLGAALRHAGRDLAAQATHRRLVLVLSDGEPSDIDCPDPRYLVEDARRAVQSLAAQGIDAFCIALDSGADAAHAKIFGARNVLPIARVEQLPQRLPILYMRLTS